VPQRILPNAGNSLGVVAHITVIAGKEWTLSLMPKILLGEQNALQAFLANLIVLLGTLLFWSSSIDTETLWKFNFAIPLSYFSSVLISTLYRHDNYDVIVSPLLSSYWSLVKYPFALTASAALWFIVMGNRPPAFVIVAAANFFSLVILYIFGKTLSKLR